MIVLEGRTTASVPSAEDRINACVALVCEQQVECWAGVDQYLTQQVVPEVPYLVQTNTTIVSSRVRADSFDQSGSLPALDRFALGS